MIFLLIIINFNNINYFIVDYIIKIFWQKSYSGFFYNSVDFSLCLFRLL